MKRSVHGRRGRLLLLVIVTVLPGSVRGQREVTLASRQFSSASPAAAFEPFFAGARRRAAATTPAWDDTDGDLSAWGPALVFPLLGENVSAETILALAAPLQAEAPAAVLLFRTLGLYAAKSRLPFVDTPDLLGAIRRNLRLMERATRDLERFTGGAEVEGWGSIGVGAWLAYLELLYPDYGGLSGEDAERWRSSGVRIVEQLLVRGLLPGKGGFRRDPRDQELTLWPNALAIHALMKAYENEQRIEYEAAALEAATAIEALRDRDGTYFSTTARAGKDVRANAYLAGAFLLLFKNTGEARFRQAALAILRWLTNDPPQTGAAVSTSLHAAYLILLLDSLATQPAEPILGRRPMHIVNAGSEPRVQGVRALAARLRPAGFRYREMLDGMLQTLLLRTPYAKGRFAYDHGDSPGYAASVLLRGADAVQAAEVIERQAHMLSRPRLRQLGEGSFGAAALFAGLDQPASIDAAGAETALRRYLFLAGALALADGYSCDWIDWLAGGDRNPTLIGAQIAGAQLRFAKRFPGSRIGWLIDSLRVGRGILKTAGQEAWDPQRRVYRSRTDDGAIELLANSMMILALLQSYSLDTESDGMVRAEAVAAGLDALWDESRGAYADSSDRTGVYFSLPSNSYAAMAFLELHRATGDRAYRERAGRILEFIARDLHADGIVYQHFYHGRRASGDVWCSGCNWRVVHALTGFARLEESPTSQAEEPATTRAVSGRDRTHESG